MSAMESSSLRPPSGKPLYFVNGTTDFLFIGGLSIAAFFAFRLFSTPDRNQSVIAIAAVLLWIVNWPHFAASSYRLYESRDSIRQYPLTALVVPVLILAAVVASFMSMDRVAPSLIKIYVLWSPYHFSGQSLGITMIYARRSGYVIGRWQRLGLSTFIFGAFVSRVVRAEVGDRMDSFYSVSYPSFGLPDWKLPGSDYNVIVAAVEAVMFAGAALFLGFVVYRWTTNRERPPWILFVPALAHFVWFVASPPWDSYREFVPMFHGLQYLYIAWAVRLKGKMDRESIAPSRRYVWMESVKWTLLIVFGGAVLFFGLPYVGRWTTGLSLFAATGIVSAGIQLHHFFVDGVIWKLRSKSVSSPLMVNLDDLTHAPPSPQPSAVPAFASGA